MCGGCVKISDILKAAQLALSYLRVGEDMARGSERRWRAGCSGVGDKDKDEAWTVMAAPRRIEVRVAGTGSRCGSGTGTGTGL